MQREIDQAEEKYELFLNSMSDPLTGKGHGQLNGSEILTVNLGDRLATPTDSKEENISTKVEYDLASMIEREQDSRKIIKTM
eukprot:3565619-Rhodomonas_salina.1